MYQSLQGCRAVAAALVVLFHMGGMFAQDRYFGLKALDGPFAWGDAGVDFFFVLSGFLITIAHRKDFGQPRALLQYLGKRTLRIYPTYWLVCLAVSLAAFAVPSLRQALPDDLLVYLGALTLLPMDPAAVGGTGSPILFVAWSLQYEMLFYAIVAIFIGSRVAGFLTVVALLALSMTCQIGGSCGFPLSFVTSNMIILFGVGVVCAYVSMSRLVLPYPLALAAASAAAFVAFGLFEVGMGRGVVPFVDRRFIYGILSGLIILGLVQAEEDGTLVFSPQDRWPSLLGNASYALYLIHVPIISVFCKLFLSLGLTARPALASGFVVVFIVCVVSSVLFHRYIERPMLRRLSALVSIVSRQPFATAASDATLGQRRTGSLL